ncbi:hypothetical protein AALO_G00188010 [Alosa alosa]|uniref:Uncharacterized protein n=1 Tax=Alosa alosa TaxID=278164 RepID=A0AAV6G524_9TELE|nr:hypothetical protein AALO_G00188010 [Alosa alosa]
MTQSCSVTHWSQQFSQLHDVWLLGLVNLPQSSSSPHHPRRRPRPATTMLMIRGRRLPMVAFTLSHGGPGPNRPQHTEGLTFDCDGVQRS